MSQVRIYDFMGLRKAAIAFSAILLVVSIASLAMKGLVFGLDFTGGTQIELKFEQPANVEAVRSALSNAGMNNPVVAHFGSDYDILLRLQEIPDTRTSVDGAQDAAPDAAPAAEENGLEQRIHSALAELGNDYQIQRMDYVGPQVGDELREQGGLGMLAALIVVMLYVAIRFQYKFAIGSVVALIHDVIITLGFFSITGLEFDLTVLAAVLAVVGYSLNDTIIVFDRIRENFRAVRGSSPAQIINESISQTLWRTVNTSFTTMLVLAALYFVGGELIHNFSIALLVGIFIGTYSSIYVAANLLMMMKIEARDLMEERIDPEGAEFDGLP